MKKFSSLLTDEAADIVCQITPYIEEIVTDDELMELIRDKIDLKETSKIELASFALEKIAKIAPILLKKKREAVYHILSPFCEKSIEEIGKQNFIVTISQIKTLVKDKELMELFTS